MAPICADTFLPLAKKLMQVVPHPLDVQDAIKHGRMIDDPENGQPHYRYDGVLYIMSASSDSSALILPESEAAKACFDLAAAISASASKSCEAQVDFDLWKLTNGNSTTHSYANWFDWEVAALEPRTSSGVVILEDEMLTRLVRRRAVRPDDPHGAGDRRAIRGRRAHRDAPGAMRAPILSPSLTPAAARPLAGADGA